MADRERVRREVEEGTEALSSSYFLDESDPDVLVLRRQNGTFVAAFSAQGATREGIVEAAEEDHEALLASPSAVGSPGGRETKGLDSMIDAPG